MKKITIRLGMLLIPLLAMMNTASLHAQENLVLNGDFEANTEVNPEDSYYWIKNNGDIKLTELDNSINNQSCRMPGLKAVRFINQNIAIATPGTYVLKFTGRIQNAVGGSGEFENNHADKGIATITATVKGYDVDGETLLENDLLLITTQSNANITLSEEFEIPETITKIQVQIHKDWNVAYVDDVMLYSGTSGILQPAVKGLRVSAENRSIRIESITALSDVRLYDMSGRLMQTHDLQGQARISINNVTKGMYLISVTDVHGNTDKIKQIIY